LRIAFCLQGQVANQAQKNPVLEVNALVPDLKLVVPLDIDRHPMPALSCGL